MTPAGTKLTLAGANRKQSFSNTLISGLQSALEVYYPCYANQNVPEPNQRGGTSLTYNGTYAVNQFTTPKRGIKSRYMGTVATTYHWLSRASPFGWNLKDNTMCCWVNMRAKATEMGILSRYQATMEEFILSYDVTNNKFRWMIYSPTFGTQLIYDTYVTNPLINTWYFVCCGVSNNLKTIFLSVNANPFVRLTLPDGSFSYSNVDFRLGRYNSSGVTGTFQGNICHFMRFNRAITEQECQFLYNRGMVNMYPFNK